VQGKNKIAAVVLLGIALLIFHILPMLLGRLDKAIHNEEDDKARWSYAVDMIAMLLRVDIVFTVIAILTQSSNYCSLTDRSLGWSMFGICSIFGIAAIIMSAIYTYEKLNDANKLKFKEELTAVSFVGVVFFASLALLLYLLANNEQPLDCVWGCDSFASNSSRMDAANKGISCSERSNSGLRFGFMTTSFASIVIALLWLLCSKKIDLV